MDWSLYRPHQYAKPPEVAKVTPVHVPAVNLRPTGKTVKVCVIPDIHISPEVPHDRMLWIGRWCNDMAPDYIVQLGDWLTLDSLSTHAKPGTTTKFLQPSFQDDIGAGERSMALFEKGLQQKQGTTDNCPRIITYGNHEFRAHRFEDGLPELQGTIVNNVDRVFTAGGFRIVPYGEFLFIEGVGLIHHANNTLGRPYGGKTANQRIATDSNFSTISGHTHQRQSASVPKIGPNLSVRSISAGCALPYGHVEQYAKHSTNGWDYGCLLVTICKGQILDERWFHMLSLEDSYAD